MTFTDALTWIVNEFPVFAYDAVDGRYIDETVSKLPFEEERKTAMGLVRSLAEKRIRSLE